MCGILGAIKKKELSTKYIVNRGPDSVGKYNDQDVIFYHSRLSIIDRKETSNQPIVNGDCVLICNGEIYNHEKIKELGDYSYISTSDCEAIIHVYKLFGVEGLNYLDGAFSFALYDKSKKKLILHRDNVGKKPIYFMHQDDDFIFSSNVTAIAENYGGKLNINKKQIDFYLKNGFISPSESIFNEIEPLLPGEVLEFDVDKKSASRFFLNKKCSDYRDFDFADKKAIQKEIEKLIESAIAKRIKGVESPVILFSGGIDSTVLAYFTNKLNNKMKLISVKQPIRFLNDEPYIRQASKILKKKVIFVRLFGRGFFKNIEAFINNLDQPLSIYSYYFLAALALKAREFGRVLFTGDGADEVFLGYGEINDWLNGSRINQQNYVKIGPDLPGYFSDYGKRAAGFDLVSHGFVKIDKATSENHVESRIPYLDWNLMCFVRKIPRNYWEETGSKYPLKKALSELFPQSFIERRKIGFSYPFRYIMIPYYFKIISCIRKNSNNYRRYFGVDFKTPGFFELFFRFDYFWRIFVLFRFFNNNKDIFKL